MSECQVNCKKIFVIDAVTMNERIPLKYCSGGSTISQKGGPTSEMGVKTYYLARM